MGETPHWEGEPRTRRHEAASSSRITRAAGAREGRRGTRSPASPSAVRVDVPPRARSPPAPGPRCPCTGPGGRRPGTDEQRDPPRGWRAGGTRATRCSGDPARAPGSRRAATRVSAEECPRPGWESLTATRPARPPSHLTPSFSERQVCAGPSEREHGKPRAPGVCRVAGEGSLPRDPAGVLVPGSSPASADRRGAAVATEARATRPARRAASRPRRRRAGRLGGGSSFAWRWPPPSPPQVGRLLGHSAFK